MKLRLDLHVHTINSADSRNKIGEVIARCSSAGLDGFAITDHDALSTMPDEARDNSGLLVISGLEVSARGAHILAFDVSEPIPADLTIVETVERIHDQGGIAALAHPYGLFKSSVMEEEASKARFDSIEVANASHLPYRWNLRRGIALAERLGLPMIGGSDAHVPEVIGRAYTLVESSSRDQDAVLEAIRRGATEAGGRGVSPLEKLVTALRIRMT